MNPESAPAELDNGIEFQHGQAVPPRGRLFVLSGPSGVGKGTLLGALLSRVSGLVKSVSATTRAPRPGEIEGVNYHFLSREQFAADIAHNRFFEYAEYNKNYYGTPCDPVESLRAQGLDVILEIEVQGAMIVRALAADAILIFIQPPSLSALEERLRKRGTDSDARITERLGIARSELALVRQYDYAVINDDLETALDYLRAVILAERCRIQKQEPVNDIFVCQTNE